MASISKRPSYALILVLALMARGLVAWGQAGWKASSHPVELQRVPTHIDSWKSKDIKLDPGAQKLLTPDAYLWRSYSSDRDPPVDLFVVYGHAKNTFHSPGFCLPGSGWQVTQKREIYFDYGSGGLSMTLFHIQKEGMKQLVLFSFLSGNSSTASLYHHNWNLLVDRIFHRSNGGALLRIIIPTGKNEKHALDTATRFAKSALPPIREELVTKRSGQLQSAQIK